MTSEGLDAFWAEYAEMLRASPLSDAEKRRVIANVATVEMLMYGKDWPKFYRQRCEAIDVALRDLGLKE